MKKYALIGCVLMLGSLSAYAQKPPDPPGSLSHIVDTTSARLFWGKVIEAVKYSYEVATDNKFGPHDLVKQGNTLTDTTVLVESLVPGTSYYWHVSVEVGNKTSGWSDYDSLTTLDVPPSSPRLISPSNGATGEPVNTTLKWGSVTAATSYDVQLSSQSDFSSPKLDINTSATTADVSGLSNNIKYYWRVRARNSAGPGGWTSASFTTIVAVPSAPSIVYPSNGATGVPSDTLLIWTKVKDATSHSLEVYTSDDYKGQKYASYSGPDTSYALSGLDKGRTYYWQVNAANAAGISGWQRASFTTATGLPPAPELIAPPDGATEPSTSVLLVWRSVGNAKSYSVQVSKGSDFKKNDIIGESSGSDTTYTVSGLNAGSTYYWHASALNDAGPSEWSSTFNFKILSAKPQAPVLVSPADQDTGVSVSPLLVWRTVANAAQYTLQLASGSRFKINEIIAEVSGKDTSYQAANLQNSTIYYWRANASNEAGPGNWAYASFKTVSKPSTGGQKPSPPTLVSPANGATDVSTSPTLVWIRVKDATSYSIELATKKNYPSSEVIKGASTDTSYVVSGLAEGQKYYWHVSATGTAGASDWSADFEFTTATVRLPAPLPVAPLDGAQRVSTSPTLVWRKVAGATLYGIELAKNDKFNGNSVIGGNTTDTSYTVSGLDAGSTYYWHVNASGSGGTSEWSTTRNFTTESGRPPVPLLIAPVDSATGIPINPRLIWASVPGATSYTAEITTKQNFSGQPIDTSTGPDTSFTPKGLEVGKVYYWHVSASNAVGSGEFSAPFSFTTSEAILAPPVLLSPTNNARDVPVNPTLKWTTSPGAISYTVQYTTDRKFNDVVEINGVTQTSVTLLQLAGKTSFFWRVRGSDGINVSEWSLEWTFTTGSIQLQPPTLLDPLDRSKGLPLNLVLSWSKVPGARSYGLEVSADRKFGTLVVDVKGLDSTSLQVKGLLANTTYYWRANAADSTSTSDWSKEEWFFTTGTSNLGRPILLSPFDGMRGVSINTSLQWKTSPGATSYAIQVKTKKGGKDNLVVDTANVKGTTFDLRGLDTKETYYWKVNASDSIETSDWSEEWSFVTGSGQLTPPKHISPRDKTTGISTKPKLKWDFLPEAISYNLQVSTNQAFENLAVDVTGLRSTSLEVARSTRTGSPGLVVDTTGLKTTSFEIPLLDAQTTYYWHVSAVDSTGSGDWSLETSFTTGSSLLSSPAPLSPPNTSTGISPNPNLSWEPSSGAASYTIQYATNKQLNKDVVEVSGIVDTTYVLSSLSAEETYYWRVRAKDAAASSDWSEAWSFTTGPNRLSTPLLSSPRDGDVVDSSATLSWSESAGAKFYHLQVGSDRNFRNLLVERTAIEGTSYTLDNLESKQTFYWRIQAIGVPDTSDWSDVWSFKTRFGKLSKPRHLAPPDNAVGIPLHPELRWEASPDAASYNLQVAKDKNFQRIVIDTTGVLGTSVILSGLEPGTTYYWRLSAVGAGDQSDWSLETSFTTALSVLAVPLLLSPPDDATGVSTNPTLTWQATSGASSYVLQYSSDKQFRKDVVEINSIKGTSYAVNSLSAQQTYYWRVQARDTLSASDWSPAWSFTTLSARLTAPVLISPKDGEIVTSSPTLRWSASSNAKSYSLQLASDRNFLDLVIGQHDIDSTSYALPRLDGQKTYYWRIQAISVQDTSEWSDVWSFTLSPATSVERLTDAIPSDFELHQNYPNPFNPTTTIAFSIPEISFVRIAVYSVLGSEVEVLVEEELIPGNYHVRWNAASHASGTYFYRVHAIPKNGAGPAEFIQTRKLMLVK